VIAAPFIETPARVRDTTAGASLASLAVILYELGELYFTAARWSIFYVSTLENILRFKRREYFTYLRGRIFYVSKVENILRILGKVYSTFPRWRIFYVSQVENILRLAGRVYLGGLASHARKSAPDAHFSLSC